MRLVIISLGVLTAKFIFNLNQVPVKSKLIRQTPHQYYTDSFLFHYRILDAINKKTIYNTSASGEASVKFMEKLTGIKSHRDGNFFGWFEFTKVDLINWLNWYNQQRKRIHN